MVFLSFMLTCRAQLGVARSHAPTQATYRAPVVCVNAEKKWPQFRAYDTCKDLLCFSKNGSSTTAVIIPLSEPREKNLDQDQVMAIGNDRENLPALVASRA